MQSFTVDVSLYILTVENILLYSLQRNYFSKIKADSWNRLFIWINRYTYSTLALVITRVKLTASFS